MQSSKLGMWKRYHVYIEGMQKGNLFCQKRYIKGQMVGPRGGASPKKNLLSRMQVMKLVFERYANNPLPIIFPDSRAVPTTASWATAEDSSASSLGRETEGADREKRGAWIT